VSKQNILSKNPDETGTADKYGRSDLKQMISYFWILIIVWTILILCMLCLNFIYLDRTYNERAKAEAMTNFNKDQAFRFWSAKHGGIYVPANSRTPPNPYLDHIPERDIVTASGKVLTLMNPAYMLRQMMDEYQELFGVHSHITSLKYFREETAPDEWERSALVGFEKGDKEAVSFEDIGGRPFLRFMRPMEVQKSCLKCHFDQGYKVGDVRGGVSVSIPMELYYKNKRMDFNRHFSQLILLWIMGVAGISLATFKLKKNMKERIQAQVNLQKAHDNLEDTVRERTRDLLKEIEDRKLAQDDLASSKEQFELILSNIQCATYQCELDQDRTMHYLSPHIDQITGYPSEEFTNKYLTYESIIHKDDTYFVAATVDKAVKLKKSWELEYRVHHRNGNICWVYEKGSAVFSSDDNVKYLTGFLIDITTRKKLEAEMTSTVKELNDYKKNLQSLVSERTSELSRANTELIQANCLKDEFLANMSHELRTPLTAILGMSEALLEQAYGSFNNQQNKSLETIKKSGQHLLNLINDILDLSKISAGKMVLELGQVSIKDLCRASLQMIKQSALKKSQTVFLDMDSQTEYIIADMLRLKQILVNLLINAVKFTPENGKIGLEVALLPDEDRVEFTVWDTGIGIAKEEMVKLFQPFVQLDGRLSRSHEGTGLGLSLVQKLVGLHKGSVRVDSEKDKFTRVTVALPWDREIELMSNEKIDPPMTDLADGANEKAVSTNKAKILVIDDNQSVVETLANYLKAKAYDCLVGHDGYTAITLAAEYRPDLILMDIQMPGMDGLEAIKNIRNWQDKENPDIASKIRKTPIIALTALAMAGDREICIEAGGNEYLSKPVGLKLMIKTIKRLLDRSCEPKR